MRMDNWNDNFWSKKWGKNFQSPTRYAVLR